MYNIAGLEIDNITTTAGYSQLINKPTHFINGTSSCIDLIFSSNVSFIRNYGIEQSIYEKCHHNITYGTLDFNAPLPPPYYREIWDYKNADTESIQKTISNFDWPKLFRNKNAKLYIFRNYIPHKTKKFDYKTPEWMNTLIISALKKRSILVKRYYRNPSEYNKETLLNQANECTKLITEAKQNYSISLK